MKEWGERGKERRDRWRERWGGVEERERGEGRKERKERGKERWMREGERDLMLLSFYIEY